MDTYIIAIRDKRTTWSAGCPSWSELLLEAIHDRSLTHSYYEYPHLSLLWRIKITAPEISSLAPLNLSPHNSSRRLSYPNLLYK